MVTVQLVDPARTRALRRAVLRPLLDPAAPLPADDVDGAVHVAALDGPDPATAAVLSTCLVYPAPCPWRPGRSGWRLRSMATWPEHRGAGLGAAVVERAVRHVADQGAQVLWCHARESAIAFWTRAGFVGHGEVFAEGDPPIPHLHMALEPLPDPTSSSSTGRSAGA